MTEQFKRDTDKDAQGVDTKKLARKQKIKKILKTMVIVGLVIGVTGFGAALAVAVGYIMDAPPCDLEKLTTVETSYLYDRNGVEVAKLHDEQNRVIVTMDVIPKHVQDAFVAAEDERFYKHFGFDIIGMVRAAITIIKEGTISQGGSTITQQLARGAFLSNEVKIERKVKEIWLAIQLERLLSKEEILEHYLNRIPFGNFAYGVEAAAQTYFNKSISEVNIAEAAMLAGIINEPSYSNPLDNESDAIAKRNSVLNNMLRLEYINEEQHREALNTEMVYGEPPNIEFPHPYYVDYVVHYELIRILTSTVFSDLPREEAVKEAYDMIYKGGIKVYSSLNLPLQTHVENTLNNAELYPRTIYLNKEKVKEAISKLPPEEEEEINLSYNQLMECVDEENGVPQPQAAIVVADPTTGEILALGGGREYNKKNNQLLRYTSMRQPGSAIKPLVTYSPAFELGILAGAGSALDDSPFLIGEWAPENFDYKFRGMISVRSALLYSFNLPAVRAFQMVTPAAGVSNAQRMGISTFDPVDFENLSVTLGGVTNGVTALDMAQAYGVLANKGIKNDFHTVRRIEDSNGNIIYEFEPEPRQILKPQTTFLVTDILQDMVRPPVSYLAGSLSTDGRDVAAKTGTTNNWRDVYLVAYTPNLVASFWMGYDEPRAGSIQQGWSYSTKFLAEVFKEAFKELPKVSFERPPGIVSLEVCSKSGLLPTDLCYAAGHIHTDYFLADQVPRLYPCDMHVEAEVCAESGKMPGDYCPRDQIEVRPFLNRAEPLITDDRWKFGPPGRQPDDASLMPPKEQCDLHVYAYQTPADFTASAVTSQMVWLSWQHSGDDLREFRLYRRVEGDGEQQDLGNIDRYTRNYTDYEVEAGKIYIYTLYAVSNRGSSSHAAETTITLEGYDRPAKPKNLEATYTGFFVHLTWSPGDYVGSHFIIERRKDNGRFSQVARVPFSQREYSDYDLEPGSRYTYRVKADNYGVQSQHAQVSIDIPEEDDDD